MANPISQQHISCLLLEDDQQWLSIMEETLKTSFPGLSVYPHRTITEAGHSYAEHQQSLLILDINLPDGLSLDWLKLLQEQQHNFRVIFTTAHAGYALSAFRFSALDFLLKPYLPAELTAAVDKAMQSLNDQHYRKQLETFMHNYTHEKKEDRRIVLKTLEEIFVVNLADILVAEADNSYTRFFLKNGQQILVSQSLKEYDQQLSPSGFMRVHQSYLVHLRYILAYRKKTNTLVLENDLQIPVSQNKKTNVMTYLNSL